VKKIASNCYQKDFCVPVVYSQQNPLFVIFKLSIIIWLFSLLNRIQVYKGNFWLKDLVVITKIEW
jgi:hypothetical protein